MTVWRRQKRSGCFCLSQARVPSPLPLLISLGNSGQYFFLLSCCSCVSQFGRRVKSALNKREEKSEGNSYSSQPDLACLFSTQCCTAPFPAVGCYKICLYLHFSPRCRSHKDSFSLFPAYFFGRRGDRLLRSIGLELKHTYTHTPAHTKTHTHKPSSCSALHQGNSEGI